MYLKLGSLFSAGSESILATAGWAVTLRTFDRFAGYSKESVPKAWQGTTLGATPVEFHLLPITLAARMLHSPLNNPPGAGLGPVALVTLGGMLCSFLFGRVLLPNSQPAHRDETLDSGA